VLGGLKKSELGGKLGVEDGLERRRSKSSSSKMELVFLLSNLKESEKAAGCEKGKVDCVCRCVCWGIKELGDEEVDEDATGVKRTEERNRAGSGGGRKRT
jgi:hypothetical protein